MGWINSQIAADSTHTRLQKFEQAYPRAKVEVSNVTSGIVAAVYEVGNLVCKIYARQHMKITEYRGITYATAEFISYGVATCSKVALRTTCGSSWAVVPMLIGTERSAAISRSNDAGGYKLTVTEMTVELATSGNIACNAGTPVTNGDVTVSWENGTSA